MKDRLKQLQETYKMSQQDFARAMGITSGALSNIYSERSRPTANHVSGVHLAFPEVSVNWLMFGEGEMFVGKSPVANEQEVTSRQVEVMSRRAMDGGAGLQVGSEGRPGVEMRVAVEETREPVAEKRVAVAETREAVVKKREAVAEVPDRFSGNGADAEMNMRGESAQMGSRDDERYSDDEPLVNFAFDKMRGDVVVQPGLFDADAEGAAESPVSSALALEKSAVVGRGVKSGGVGAKSSGVGVESMREKNAMDGARMMSSQPAVTSPQPAVTSPQSVVAQTPNESEMSARNFDTTARRISEIKVFYDDGTYETFLPSRR